MSTSKPTPITERQLDLITRAHCDAGGLIEPLLTLKGGAKLKMIASLDKRGLIAQRDGQWRITPAAVMIVKGEALPTASDAARPDDPTDAGVALADEDIADDPEIEAAVSAAEADAHTEKQAGKPTRRADSKQATVIAMLQRPEGATIAQIMDATGWQAHTVRGTFAGAFKKRLGLTVISDKTAGSSRVYRLQAA